MSTLTELWTEDRILHPKLGFGVVEDTIAYECMSQKIYVHFDDDTYHVFDSKEVCKIIHGIAYPYSKKDDFGDSFIEKVYVIEPILK